MRPLKVAFESLEALVESIQPGLSRTHVFVETPEAIPAETRVRLEIGVAGEAARIRGVAKVAGQRVTAEATPTPGLHLDVIHLDPPSTRFVDSIVKGGIAAGAARQTSLDGPFEMAPAVRAATEKTPDRPPVATPRVADRLRRIAWPLAFLALLGAFLLALELVSGRDEGRLLTGRDRMKPPEPASEIAPGAVAPGAVAPGAEEAPPAPDPEAARKEVESTVRSWAEAWSEQRADDYLGLYAEDFHPPGLARDDWQRERRARIAAPESIEVRLSALEVELTGTGRAVARFHQLYVTESVRLATRKALELERRDAGWRIVAERAERD